MITWMVYWTWTGWWSQRFLSPLPLPQSCVHLLNLQHFYLVPVALGLQLAECRSSLRTLRSRRWKYFPCYPIQQKYSSHKILQPTSVLSKWCCRVSTLPCVEDVGAGDHVSCVRLRGWGHWGDNFWRQARIVMEARWGVVWTEKLVWDVIRLYTFPFN